jgi:hypothetical protein
VFRIKRGAAKVAWIRAARSTQTFGILLIRKMKIALTTLFLSLSLAIVADADRLTLRASDPPPVEYCSLIANPSAYDGKEIRLTGTFFVIGSDNSTFFSSSCIGKTLWVDFDANYESCSAPSAVKSLATMRRKSGWRWGRPHVTVIEGHSRSAAVEFTGRFVASNPFAKAASPDTDGPLGPIRSSRELSDFVFTVTCINSLHTLPQGARR